jgi:hypothetical protein
MSMAWDPEREMFNYAEAREIEIQTPVEGDPLAAIRGWLFAAAFSLPFWLVIAIVVLAICGGKK